MNNNPFLYLKNITKTYHQGETHLNVLNGVSLDLMPGKTLALMGASGSGKSTLLHIAGLLDPATTGEVWLNGQSAHGLTSNRKTLIRGQFIGFVYQFHHLLPEFTALENVMLPLLVKGEAIKAATEAGLKLLKMLKLEHRSTHRPSQLSGGEQQRIAIPRAIANKPKILLADEPTGNLDEQTATQVFKELMDIIKEEKIAALIATHDMNLAQKMDQVMHLKEGQVYLNSDSDP